MSLIQHYYIYPNFIMPNNTSIVIQISSKLKKANSVKKIQYTFCPRVMGLTVDRLTLLQKCKLTSKQLQTLLNKVQSFFHCE